MQTLQPISPSQYASSQSFDKARAMKALFGEAPKKSVLEKKIESLLIKYASNDEMLENICEYSHIPQLLGHIKEVRIETQEELNRLQDIVFSNQICQMTKGL